MPASKIRIEQQIILAVKNAVFAKHCDPGLDSIPALASIMYRDFHETFGGNLKDWNSRIASYTKQFKNSPVDIRNKPFETFVILCSYLDVCRRPVAGMVFNAETAITIIKELENQGFITDELFRLQKRHFSETTEIEYTVYVSTGITAPAIGYLKLSFNEEKTAELRLDAPLDEVHTGTFICNHGKIFVSLSDSVSTFPSNLSLKQMRGGDIKDSHLQGFFCSFKTSGEENPVSREVIAINKILPAGSNSPDPDQIHFKLFNKHAEANSQQFNQSLLKKFCFQYTGYWFRVKSACKIVRINFEISQDGACTITGSNEKLEGRVTNIDIHKNVLTCVFWGSDLCDSLQMVLDIKHDQNGYYDGVYSGQKPPDTDIIAGKIRLYKVDAENPILSPEVIPLEKLNEKDKKRAEELKQFFTGINEETPSSKFVQPNISTYRRWFEPGLLYTVPEVNQFNGYYLVWKLDSNKKHINQYEFFVQNGEITGVLRLPGREKHYKGAANFLNNCLMFNIHRRNGNKYNAVYIFYVGAGNSGDIVHASGVYATTRTFSGVPVCGRVILQRKPDKNPVYPIEIYSKEYYELNSVHDQGLTLLTGKDDNMIKVSTALNQVHRRINYGTLFFSYACQLAENDDQKLLYVRQAFENGFNNVELLKAQFSGALKNLYDAEKILVKPGKEEIVEIIYLNEKNTYSFPIV